MRRVVFTALICLIALIGFIGYAFYQGTRVSQDRNNTNFGRSQNDALSDGSDGHSRS